MKKNLSIVLLSIFLMGMMFHRTVISHGAEMESQVGLTLTDRNSSIDESWSNKESHNIQKKPFTGNKLPVTGEDVVFFLTYSGLFFLVLWLIVVIKRRKGVGKK